MRHLKHLAAFGVLPLLVLAGACVTMPRPDPRYYELLSQPAIKHHLGDGKRLLGNRNGGLSDGKRLRDDGQGQVDSGERRIDAGKAASS